MIKTTAILDSETKSHYWLTVFAQDHGVVPLFSSVEIYIEVLNENDNVPLSELPVYYPVIPEDSPAGTIVLQIKATDRDKDPNQEIFYKIAAGNPEGFFAINSSTGIITTTARKLDREAQDEHILEIALIVGVAGACRKSELTFLRVENVEFQGQFIKVTIPNTKTKVCREFAITTGAFDCINCIEMMKKYILLRPSNVKHDRFFVKYSNGKCGVQPVGINTFGNLPKMIAEFLKLPNPRLYTGHYFRRTSTTLLADSGADILRIKQHGGGSRIQSPKGM